MLREQVLDQTLNLLEQRGLATLSLASVAELVDVPLNELTLFGRMPRRYFMTAYAITATRSRSGVVSYCWMSP